MFHDDADRFRKQARNAESRQPRRLAHSTRRRGSESPRNGLSWRYRSKAVAGKAASVGGLFPRQARHRLAGPIAHRLNAFGAALLGSSEIGISTASNAKSGACLAVPVHDAIVGVDLPETVKSKLSMPKTEGCPCVCGNTCRKFISVHYV
jgi:hypothetical protein